jgi:hypothetical protein
VRIDALLALMLVVGTAPALATDWQAHGVTASAVLQSGPRKFTANLTVNCSDNSTMVFVQSGGLSAGDKATVSYVLDRGAVQSAQWRACQSGDCVGLSGGAGIAFAQSLFDKAALKMLIARKYGEQVEVDVQVAGARAALQPMGEKCGCRLRSCPPEPASRGNPGRVCSTSFSDRIE